MKLDRDFGMVVSYTTSFEKKEIRAYRECPEEEDDDDGEINISPEAGNAAGDSNNLFVLCNG